MVRKNRELSSLEKYWAAKLVILRTDFKVKLEERIVLGRELLNRDINNIESLEKLKKDYSKWNSWNQEYLKQSFNYQDNQYLNDYNWWWVASILYWEPSFYEKVKDKKEDIEDKIEKLDILLEKVDLIPEDNLKKIDVETEIENYFSFSRIKELKDITNDNFDLCKLIKILEEVNVSYQNKCYLWVSSLLRMLIDHIPPIFWKSNFRSIVAEHAFSKSDKENMKHLLWWLKNISDWNLHWQISNLEILPNETTIEFRADFDVLLKNIILELNNK